MSYKREVAGSTPAAPTDPVDLRVHHGARSLPGSTALMLVAVDLAHGFALQHVRRLCSSIRCRSTRPDPDPRHAHGVPVTAPARTIVDALDAGSPQEQIEVATRQALARGLTTPRRLRDAARTRSRRVRAIVHVANRDIDDFFTSRSNARRPHRIVSAAATASR